MNFYSNYHVPFSDIFAAVELNQSEKIKKLPWRIELEYGKLAINTTISISDIEQKDMVGVYSFMGNEDFFEETISFGYGSSFSRKLEKSKENIDYQMQMIPLFGYAMSIDISDLINESELSRMTETVIHQMLKRSSNFFATSIGYFFKDGESEFPFSFFVNKNQMIIRANFYTARKINDLSHKMYLDYLNKIKKIKDSKIEDAIKELVKKERLLNLLNVKS